MEDLDGRFRTTAPRAGQEVELLLSARSGGIIDARDMTTEQITGMLEEADYRNVTVFERDADHGNFRGRGIRRQPLLAGDPPGDGEHPQRTRRELSRRPGRRGANQLIGRIIRKLQRAAYRITTPARAGLGRAQPRLEDQANNLVLAEISWRRRKLLVSFPAWRHQFDA